MIKFSQLTIIVLLIGTISTVRHPSIFDGLQDNKLIQTYTKTNKADNSWFNMEAKNGHLSLQSALDIINNKDCGEEEDEYDQWIRVQIFEWITIFSSKTKQLEIFSLVEKKRTVLIQNCEKVDSDYLKGQTTEVKPSNAYTYQSSCLMHFIEEIDEDEDLAGEDLCRHILPSIEELYTLLTWITTISDTQYTEYHKELKVIRNTYCCHPDCETCEGKNKDDCEICSTVKNFKLTPNEEDLCVCKEKHFPVTEGSEEGSCQPCTDAKCAVCNAANQCTTCNHPDFMEGDNCECIEGYIEEAHECKKCAESCKTCSKPNSGEFCIECDESEHREKVATSASTRCVCMDGFSEVNGKCEACNPSCDTCAENNVDKCESCKESDKRQKVGDECLCIKEKGYGWDKLKNGDEKVAECGKCHHACLTCINNEVDSCLKCDETRTMRGRRLFNACECKGRFFSQSEADGAYDEEKHGFPEKCKPCHETCETCSSETTCDTCKDAENMEKTENGLCKCIKGVFSNGECKDCHPSCGENNCSVPDDEEHCHENCPETRVKHVNPDGSYKCLPKPHTFECGKVDPCPCSDDCKQCGGASDSECTSCEEGKDLKILNKETKQGSCECPKTQKEEGGQCVDCPSTMETCVAPNIECKKGLNRKLNGKGDACKCKQGHVEIAGGEMCIQCDEKCKKCEDNTSNCTLCTPEQGRLLENNCECAAGHFEDKNGICKECDDACKTCNGPMSTDCIVPKDPETQEVTHDCSSHFIFAVESTSQMSEPFEEGINFSGIEKRADLAKYAVVSWIKEKQGIEKKEEIFNDISILYFNDSIDEKVESSVQDVKLQLSNNIDKDEMDIFVVVDSIEAKIKASEADDNKFVIQIIMQADVNVAKSSYFHRLMLLQNKIKKLTLVSLQKQPSSFMNSLKQNFNKGIVELVYYENPKQLVEHFKPIPCTPETPEEPTCIDEKHFYNEIDNNCEECDANCNECEGSATHCTNCHENQVLNDAHKCICPADKPDLVHQTCFEKCKKNEFREEEACKPCDASCDSCDGPTEQDCQSCEVGKFLKNEKCEECPAECTKCDSLAKCTECKLEENDISLNKENKDGKCQCQEGYEHLAEGSLQCVITCQAGEVRTSNTNCEPCHPLCKECKGVTANDCKECVKNAGSDKDLVHKDGKCEAPVGCVVLDESSGLVKCCKENCEECEATQSLDQCIECADEHHEIDEETKRCECEEGYFADTEKTCKKCDKKCETCKLKSECETCMAGRGEAPECNCLDHHYAAAENEDGRKTCEECHVTCKTCHGAEKDNCDECYPEEFNREKEGSECKPIEGHYENNKKEPGECHPTCKDCLGAAETDCTACDTADGYILKIQSQEHQSGKCIPKPGTFRPEPTPEVPNPPTKPCHYSCKTCDDAITCNECKDGRVKPTGSDLCEDCEGKFFDAPESSHENKCEECHPSCDTCFGKSETECKTCEASLNRVEEPQDAEGHVKCVCKEGFNDIGGVCKACDKKCNICEGGQCIECKEGRKPDEKGVCVIDKGHVECDPPKDEACPCDVSCLECKKASDPKMCSVCNPAKNQELIAGKGSAVGTCECMKGFFEKNNVCFACDDSCDKCTAADKASCVPNECNNEDNYEWIEKTKLCECKAGYFYDNEENKCSFCHKSCEKCTGGAENQCEECNQKCELADQNELVNGLCKPKEGYFRIKEDINKCPVKCDENCKACAESSTHCISCDEEKNLYLTNQNTCGCKDGYYLSENECIKCAKECAECDADKCKKCKGQFTEVNAEGECVCDAGHVKVEKSFNCAKPNVPSVVIPVEEPEPENEFECITINRVMTKEEYEKERDEEEESDKEFIQKEKFQKVNSTQAVVTRALKSHFYDFIQMRDQTDFIRSTNVIRE